MKELIQCPFYSCMFCTIADLDRHIAAFRDRNTIPNKFDHQKMFTDAHQRLEYSRHDHD